MGVSQLTAGSITSSWRRISLNFLRRYKWVFDPEFDKLAPAEPIPDLFAFPPVLQALVQVRDALVAFGVLLNQVPKDGFYSPAGFVQLARDILLEAHQPQEWVGHWGRDRIQVGCHIMTILLSPTHHVHSTWTTWWRCAIGCTVRPRRA